MSVPRSVRTASLMLLICSAIGILDVLAAWLAERQFQAVLPDYLQSVSAYDYTEESAYLRGNLSYAMAIGVGAAILLPVGLAIRRPWRYARRIGLWLAGALLAIIIVGFMSAPDSGDVVTMGGELEPEPSASLRRALVPAWFTSGHQLAMAALSVMLIVILVQLLRSTSAEYFRRQRTNIGPGLWTIAERQPPPS
jgi:hypothetical protein